MRWFLLLLLSTNLRLTCSFGSLQYLRNADGVPAVGTYTAPYNDVVAQNQLGTAVPSLLREHPLTYNNEIQVGIDENDKLTINLMHNNDPPPPSPSPPPKPPPTPLHPIFAGGVCTGCIGYGCEDCCEYITAYEYIPSLEPPFPPPSLPPLIKIG